MIDSFCIFLTFRPNAFDVFMAQERAAWSWNSDLKLSEQHYYNSLFSDQTANHRGISRPPRAQPRPARPAPASTTGMSSTASMEEERPAWTGLEKVMRTWRLTRSIIYNIIPAYKLLPACNIFVIFDLHSSDPSDFASVFSVITKKYSGLFLPERCWTLSKLNLVLLLFSHNSKIFMKVQPKLDFWHKK